MTPRAAARAFVDTMIQQAFGNILDLVDPEDTSQAQEMSRRAYARVEAVIRAERCYREEDLVELANAVVGAAHPGQRAGVRRALSAFEQAEQEQLEVMREAAYLIGVEIGRAVLRGGAR